MKKEKDRHYTSWPKPVEKKEGCADRQEVNPGNPPQRGKINQSPFVIREKGGIATKEKKQLLLNVHACRHWLKVTNPFAGKKG